MGEQDENEDAGGDVGTSLHHQHRDDAERVPQRASKQRARQHEERLGSSQGAEDAAPEAVLGGRLQQRLKARQNPGCGDADEDEGIAAG
jgi:hypothetical protein